MILFGYIFGNFIIYNYGVVKILGMSGLKKNMDIDGILFYDDFFF